MGSLEEMIVLTGLQGEYRLDEKYTHSLTHTEYPCSALPTCNFAHRIVIICLTFGIADPARYSDLFIPAPIKQIQGTRHQFGRDYVYKMLHL